MRKTNLKAVLTGAGVNASGVMGRSAGGCVTSLAMQGSRSVPA
jgi:hypothetical protein